MTIPEVTQLITAIGVTFTAVAVPVLGFIQHRSTSRNHEQGKEILRVANGTLMAQTHTSAVATAALAAVQPTSENISNAADAAAVLKSRQDGKAAESSPTQKQ